MKCSGHAVLYAFGITVAQVALGCLVSFIFKVDTPKWTCSHAHPAPDALGLIDNNRMGRLISLQCACGANEQAHGDFTLHAGKGEKGSDIHIDVNPYVRVFPFKSPGFLERTNALTIAATQTTILLYKHDFHGNLRNIGYSTYIRGTVYV
jgi:hypothetical protein